MTMSWLEGGRLVKAMGHGCRRLQPSGGRSGLLFHVVDSGAVAEFEQCWTESSSQEKVPSNGCTESTEGVNPTLTTGFALLLSGSSVQLCAGDVTPSRDCCSLSLCLSFRKIVAEYEKTIAQMIGGCCVWRAQTHTLGNRERNWGGA